jgi:hypothetical protein
MSQTFVCKSQISDVGILRDALADVGVPLDAIVQQDVQQDLKGYHGSQKADILIKGPLIGTTHDVGFRRNPDGMFDILVYDYDVRHTVIGSKLTPTVNGGKGELMQHYAKHTIMKTAKMKHGHKAKTSLKDGRVKIRVEVS